MIYQSEVFALTKSITFKSIWSAFAMNQPLIEFGYDVPDDKKKWRYFMHLAGDKHELDETILVDSLDTNQLVELNKETLSVHKKTATFYRERGNREKIHELYPLHSLFIDGLFEPIDYSVSISAEDGDVLRYDNKLIEPQESSLIFEIEKWIKAEHHLYFMESYAAMYPAYTMWFIAKLYAFLPGVIMELRYRKIHTPETHTFYIKEFLRSHKGLDVYAPYLNIKQLMFLYRNIRYIERNASKQDTFDFLVQNILTERGIPLDGFDFSEQFTGMADGGLSREPVCFKVPLNFPERILGRDVEVYTLDHIIEKESESAVYHDRLLDDYTVIAENEAQRASVLSGPTKLLEVSGVDPDALRNESFVDRLVYDWAYFSGTGKYLATVDLIDPQSGNNIRLSALEAFCVFIYAFYKGFHEVELKRIPQFSCTEQEDGIWYSADDYKPGLPGFPILTTESHIDFFVSTHYLSNFPTYDVLEFYNGSRQRWYTKGQREYYLGSQRNDWDRATVEQLYRFTYKERYIDHDLSGEEYRGFLYEKGFQVGEYTPTIWRDLCADLLKQAVGYDTEASIGFSEIQEKLTELFQKLVSYTLQMSSKFKDSDSLSTESTCSLISSIVSEVEAACAVTYNIGAEYSSSYEDCLVFAPVLCNDYIYTEQLGVSVVEIDNGDGVIVSVAENNSVAVNYESSVESINIDN